MNGRLLKQSLAVVMICSALSTSAWAQSAWVHVGDTAMPCEKAPGFQILPVFFSAAGPVHTARFKVVASSPVTIVDPPGGEFDVTFSSCGSYGALGTLLVLIPAGPAVKFTVVPATGHTAIELTDCDGYALRTVSTCDNSQLLGPYRPNPPDGATDVPTDQLLSYVGDANYVALSTDPNMDIWNPANVVLCNHVETGTTGPACALPLNPGPLSPHTTYYWQAVYYCACGQVAAGYSDVFSFTTGDGPLAVEPTTWGRVKAMYRH